MFCPSTDTILVAAFHIFHGIKLESGSQETIAREMFDHSGPTSQFI